MRDEITLITVRIIVVKERIFVSRVVLSLLLRWNGMNRTAISQALYIDQDTCSLAFKWTIDAAVFSTYVLAVSETEDGAHDCFLGGR